jgi:DNA-binding transcriptional LysR family regulator
VRIFSVAVPRRRICNWRQWLPHRGDRRYRKGCTPHLQNRGGQLVNWEDLKAFLAIARDGNLSAAGRTMKVSQTTMGRRLALMERRLGAKLLQRTPSGFVLTPSGEHILANVERMEAEALAAERAVSGRDVRLEGLVRITTVESFGARILAPALVPLHLKHPKIVLEVITGSGSLSLARREADIAVRLAPFTEQEAVAQRIGEMAYGLYASPAYLAQYGEPDWSRDAEGHHVIALRDDLAALPEAQWLREAAAMASECIRSSSRGIQLSTCAAGLGLACLPRFFADPEPGLVRLKPPTSPPTRGIWLGVHRDLRHTPRVRAVVNLLAEEIRARSHVLSPPDRP